MIECLNACERMFSSTENISRHCIRAGITGVSHDPFSPPAALAGYVLLIYVYQDQI